MQPTLTQVPPRPHLVPVEDGFTKSANATLIFGDLTYRAHAIPPDPPPIIKTSKS